MTRNPYSATTTRIKHIPIVEDGALVVSSATAIFRGLMPSVLEGVDVPAAAAKGFFGADHERDE